MYIAFAYSFPPENGAMRPLINNIIRAIPDNGYIVTSRGIIRIQTGLRNEYIHTWYRVSPYTRIETKIKVRLGIPIFPDIMGYWARKAYKKATKILITEQIDTVISFSYPNSAHNAASKLAKKHGLKWIAYIADPIVNGLMYEKGSNKVKKKIELMEKNIITNASSVIVNSVSYYTQLTAKYGNVKRILHGYSEKYDQASKCVKIERRLVHYGNIYGDRSVKAWTRAINEVNNGNIEYYNYGNIKQNERESANNAGILVKGPIEYDDYIQHTKESLGLILICGESKASRICLPSKIIDYIGSMRPVFVFAPKDSEASFIARDMGFCFGDTADFSRCLNEYQKYIRKLSTKPFVSEKREKYAFSEMQKIFVKEYNK